MPIDNLAKMFGPTIVGYSSDDLDPGSMYSETAQQAKVSSWTIRWAVFILENIWIFFSNFVIYILEALKRKYIF